MLVKTTSTIACVDSTVLQTARHQLHLIELQIGPSKSLSLAKWKEKTEIGRLVLLLLKCLEDYSVLLERVGGMPNFCSANMAGGATNLKYN